jgi:murein lipoprotein
MNSLPKDIDAGTGRNLWSACSVISGIGKALRPMHHRSPPATLRRLACCSLLALQLAACGTTRIASDGSPQAGVAPAISQAAQAMLTRAVADVDYARSKFALWTTAEAALNAARDAAAAGDSAGVIKYAGYVSSQVRLGIRQLDYPTTERK